MAAVKSDDGPYRSANRPGKWMAVRGLDFLRDEDGHIRYFDSEADARGALDAAGTEGTKQTSFATL